MNNKIKILLVGLAILCSISLVIAFQLNYVNKTLRSEFNIKEQEFSQEKQSLSQQLASLMESKKKLDIELGDLRAKYDGLSKERDALKGKFDLVSKERSTLVDKIQDLARQKTGFEEEVAKLKKSGGESRSLEIKMPGDDAYWASLVREKASLELQVKGLNAQLTELQLRTDKAMDEGRKLDLQFKTVNATKGDLERRLVYNEKLAETLSEELVREKRDKKAISNQLESLRQENFELKSRFMALGDKKTSLEGKLVDLQQEREILAKRLGELDQVLQERVDQMVQVKNDLKATRAQTKEVSTKDSRVIQLQPIVVKAEDEATPKRQAVSGQVRAIDEENNFVIIDMGEDSGVKVGETFTIERNAQKIATVEVIQIRKEISAADIKNVSAGAKIKIGDAVR